MSSHDKPANGVNEIACVSCKSRKIKCNRAKPRCDCCTARRQACVYLTRKKRAKTPNFKPAVDLDKRLAEVEKLLNERLSQSRDPQRAAQAAHDSIKSCLSCQSSSALPVEASESTPSTTQSAHVKDVDVTGLGQGVPKHCDPQTRLKHAMNQVIKCKKQNLHREAASVISGVPPHLARELLDNLFHNFIDIDLMDMIPDLVDKLEVHIHPSTLMLYHVMLYHGAITSRVENSSQAEDIIRQCYVYCLQFIPFWYKQAVGSKTDLITGVLLMRAAFQQCDFEFSWSMYKLVYFCTVKLNMHVFDKGFPNAFLHPKGVMEGADQYRRGFWGLIHTDLVFRLLHGKPAMLTADFAKWHVNLPAVEINPELPAVALPNLALLMRFRLIFHMLRFYEVSEQFSGDAENMSKSIERLCKEIESLFEEWPVADLMTENEDIQTLWWVLYEVTLTAWCSVMAMSQGLANTSNRLCGHITYVRNASPHPVSVKIARRVLQLASHGMTKFPITPTASMVWGFNSCVLAYGCLVQHLTMANTKMSESRAPDMELLREVTQALANIVETDSDFKPLLIELVSLNETLEVV